MAGSRRPENSLKNKHEMSGVVTMSTGYGQGQRSLKEPVQCSGVQQSLLQGQQPG